MAAIMKTLKIYQYLVMLFAVVTFYSTALANPKLSPQSQDNLLCRTLLTEVHEHKSTGIPMKWVEFPHAGWAETEKWLQSVIGSAEPLRLSLPPTLPTSGAEVYLVVHPSRPLPAAVLKVFKKRADLEREIQAKETIQELRMRFTEVVPYLGVGTVGDEKLPALLMEYSPNLDYDARLFEYARKSDPIEKEKLLVRFETALEALSFSMLEFHTRSHDLGWGKYEIEEFRKHELLRFRETTQDLKDPTSRLFTYLKDQHGFSADQLASVRKLFSTVDQKYEYRPLLNPSLIYADAHPGNFTFEMFSGEVGIFDLEKAYYFTQGKHSADPLQDVGRFAAGLMITGFDAGLSWNEIQKFRATFFQSYFHSRQEYLNAIEALQFHELRFVAIVLNEGLRNGPKKVGEPTRKRLIEVLLNEFQRADEYYQTSGFSPEPLRGQEHWDQYDRDYQSTTREMILANLDAFLEAKKFGERYIKFAEDVWGFHFSQDPVVPTMTEIAHKQHEYLNRNGYDRDAFRMARVYSMPSGEEIWRQFGAPVPRGAKPYIGYPVVTNQLALKMLVRRYFLAAENLTFKNTEVSKQKVTISGHDSLGHHTTFALNPGFSRALTTGAMRFLSGPFEELGNPALRWVHLFEIGDLIDPEDRTLLEKSLSYPPLPNSTKHYQWTDVETHLRKHFSSYSDLVSYSHQVIDLLNRHVNSFGGALADQVQWRIRFRKYDDRTDLRPNQSLRWLAVLVEKAIEQKLPTDELYQRLAKLQTAMIESTFLTPEGWTDQAMRRQVSLDSALYQYICKGGYFTPDTQFYNAYCR